MADRIDLYNHFAMLYPEGVTFELLGGDEGAGAFVGGVFLAAAPFPIPKPSTIWNSPSRARSC